MLLLVLVALVLELVMLVLVVLVVLVLVSAQPPARVMVIMVRDVSFFSILFEAPKLLRHSNAHVDCELD